jgi:hypothetical protein
MQDADDGFQLRLGDGIGHRAQGQMGGDQRHPHAGTGQHHHHARGGGVFCQIFGMAAEWHACIVDHALVYWRCHHAGKFAGQAAGNGCIQRIQHITAIAASSTPG